MASDRTYSPKTVAWALVSGGMVGTAVALLLAPQAGCTLREQIRGYARRAEDAFHKVTGKAAQALDQAVDQGSRVIRETKSA